MVMYIEASYSDSMFEGLLPYNISVYATTATNPYQVSYACYPDVYRSVFLGDVYSVKWMEDSNREDLCTKTLIDQFELVREKTTTSNVMQYGDVRVGELPLSEFQGARYVQPIVAPEAPCNTVSIRDIPIAMLWQKMRKASSPGALLSIWSKLQRALEERASVDNKVAEIAIRISCGNEEKARELLTIKQPLWNFNCYADLVQQFSDLCFNLSNTPYMLEHLQVLGNVCEGYHTNPAMFDAMHLACT